MNKISEIKFTTNEVAQIQGANQSKNANKSLFNFNAENVDDGYASMGLEISSSSKTQDGGNIIHNTDGTTTISYDYDGDGMADEEFIRDKNGKQIESIVYTYGTRTYEDSGEEVPVKIIEHSYWDNGKRTASTRAHVVNGIEVDRYEFTYLDDGVTPSSCAKYKDGKFMNRSETSYYKDGEIFEGSIALEKEERIYDKNNQLEAIIEYTYPKDEYGNVIATVEKETDVKTGEVTIRRQE